MVGSDDLKVKVQPGEGIQQAQNFLAVQIEDIGKIFPDLLFKDAPVIHIRPDVTAGKVPFWVYLTKFEGYTEEEAKAMEAEAAPRMPTLFGGEE